MTGVLLLALGTQMGAAGSRATMGADREASAATSADVAVLQYHKHATRDGLYVDPALTKRAAARLALDRGFDVRLEGPT